MGKPVFSLDPPTEITVPLDDPEHSLSIYKDTDFSTYRHRAVEKEPWTYDWLKDFDESTLLYDIGACVGSYTLMAAARGATVVAFEPLRNNIRGLVRNLDLNNLSDNVTIVEAAVSSEPLPMFTHVSNSGVPAGYGLGSLTPDRNQTEEVEVMTVTLDAAAELYGYPTHIKIDVEGAELLVIESGPDVLARVQSVIVEIADQHAEDLIEHILEAADMAGSEVGARRTLEQRTKAYSRDN